MTFTDEDLKKLRELVPLIDTYGRWLTNGDKVNALLHRLECAEKVIEACGQDLNVSKPYEAWLKSKGQGGQGE